jgi:hypothetical protein
MIIPKVGDRVEIVISFAGNTISKGQGEFDIITEKNIILYEEMIRKGFVKIIETVKRKEKNETLDFLSNHRSTGRADVGVTPDTKGDRTSIRYNVDTRQPKPVRVRGSDAKRSDELRKDAPNSTEDGI